MLEAGVPFRVLNGNSLLDRAEILDARAYLRLLLNSSDDQVRAASDWSVVRIYPRVLRPIGPS
eukprot:1196132-Prorocentrum_minimum.AAC.1